MKKKLVIVESPAKGKTIQKYLGPDYIVEACFGHVVDLGKGGKYGIGVDVNNEFKPHYVIIEDKVKVLDNIINLAEKCSEVYIASDPDREGEAIAFHLKTRLESTGKPMKRVEFHEITKDGVSKGIKATRDINMELFHAQEARRVLDRIVGFMVSPFLINNFGPHLSAGRVQSVAVRLIVDREREIEVFNPEEYWNLTVKLQNSNKESFIAKYEGKVKNKQEAEQIKADVLGSSTSKAEFIVDKVVAKDKKEGPEAPMTTSKLQQIASKKYGFDPDHTMKLAQSLYESGYCTYIRTDSTRISDDALDSVRDYLKDNKFEVPSKPNVYKTKESAQDAHECIRPTNVKNHPDEVSLSEDDRKVYKIIWDYFVSSQMMPAVYNTLEVRIKSVLDPKRIFKASGKALKSKGYLEILEDDDAKKNSKIDIPFFTDNQVLSLVNGAKSLVSEQKFTQPPPRFTVSTFINQLETKGIGRPATFAQVVKTITNRNYVIQKGNSYYATDLGKKITDILISYFPFMDYEYTAKMENELDIIQDGKLEYLKMMESFFIPFKKQLGKAYSDHGTSVCEKCGSAMALRTNKKDNSEFLACTGFPNCKNTKSIERKSVTPKRSSRTSVHP